MRILAAIVTYNRAVLLERCVDAILAQTRPVDGLVVINNSSPDNTVEMLERRGIEYITQPNVGGAGGFNRALRHALDEGYDAVWLMDDDGFPGAEALAHLAGALKGNVSCVSSVVLREDEPGYFVFPFPAIDAEGMPRILAAPRKIGTLEALRKKAPGGTYNFAHLFNGALIPTEVVRRIGNVEAGYFIFGDEVDYFMRLRQQGPVLSHLDAHHYHPDVTRRPLNDTKLYYYIKNTIILNGRYFNKPALRNVLTVGVALARMARRNGVREGFRFAVGSKNAVVRKAVKRGLGGKIGDDFAT